MLVLPDSRGSIRSAGVKKGPLLDGRQKRKDAFFSNRKLERKVLPSYNKGKYKVVFFLALLKHIGNEHPYLNLDHRYLP